jgi:hypothetical protein
MSPDEKKLLENTAKLTKENNELLRKLYRAQILRRIIHTIYWVLIIGISIKAFYFIQPYTDPVVKMLKNIQDKQSGLKVLLDF